MPDAHKNFAYSTVATKPTPPSSGTSLVVAAGQGVLFPAVPFNATVWPVGAQPTTTNAEIIRVTNVSTDTFTIVRSQEGSSARTMVNGDQIAATITAKTLTDVEALTAAGGGAGAELAYAEITSDVTLTSTTEATPTSVISAGAVAFDGATRVCIEFFTIGLGTGVGTAAILNLWDDTTTDLGRIAVQTPAGGRGAALVRRYFTPPAATKTYRIRGWSQGTGDSFVSAGAGGAGIQLPAYIRITVVDSV